MRIFLIAIISWFLLGILSNATPEKYASGIPSLDAFLKSSHSTAGREVLGMTGFYGQDQPQQWLILTRSANAGELLQEFVICDSQVKGSRKIKTIPHQDIPTIPINQARLKVDSDTAFVIAEDLATTAKIGYDSVHYHLRCRDLDKEPVWVVNMLDPSGRSVGVHYISAESGKILRSAWFKPSSNSITTDQDQENKPTSLLYGGEVKEITVSGKATVKKREISRVVSPLVTPNQ
jgi:hypothetical protein